jgi:hypothetical protein
MTIPPDASCGVSGISSGANGRFMTEGAVGEFWRADERPSKYTDRLT